jgi:hypothetical protein
VSIISLQNKKFAGVNPYVYLVDVIDKGLDPLPRTGWLRRRHGF